MVAAASGKQKWEQYGGVGWRATEAVNVEVTEAEKVGASFYRLIYRAENYDVFFVVCETYYDFSINSG